MAKGQKGKRAKGDGQKGTVNKNIQFDIISQKRKLI